MDILSFSFQGEGLVIFRALSWHAKGEKDFLASGFTNANDFNSVLALEAPAMVRNRVG